MNNFSPANSTPWPKFFYPWANQKENRSRPLGAAMYAALCTAVARIERVYAEEDGYATIMLFLFSITAATLYPFLAYRSLFDALLFAPVLGPLVLTTVAVRRFGRRAATLALQPLLATLMIYASLSTTDLPRSDIFALISTGWTVSAAVLGTGTAIFAHISRTWVKFAYGAWVYAVMRRPLLVTYHYAARLHQSECAW